MVREIEPLKNLRSKMKGIMYLLVQNKKWSLPSKRVMALSRMETPPSWPLLWVVFLQLSCLFSSKDSSFISINKPNASTKNNHQDKIETKSFKPGDYPKPTTGTFTQSKASHLTCPKMAKFWGYLDQMVQENRVLLIWSRCSYRGPLVTYTSSTKIFKT